MVFGENVGTVEIREGNVGFAVNPVAGQKTGFFLDQRDNRLKVAAHARGSVLDMFCADGAFALHCAKAGAEKVLGIDSSAPALERAAANAERNQLSEKVTWVRGMAFDELRARSEAGERYDLVILDPPAFAKNRMELTNAFRGYVEINSRAMRLVAPGDPRDLLLLVPHDRGALHQDAPGGGLRLPSPRGIVGKAPAVDGPPDRSHAPRVVVFEGALLRIDS